MPKKEQYLVSLVKPDYNTKGMDIYGKVRKFGPQGHSFTLSDKGEAMEINQHFGRAGTGDIIVSKVPGYKPEWGHNYTFGVKGYRKDNKTFRERIQESDDMVEVRAGVWKEKDSVEGKRFLKKTE